MAGHTHLFRRGSRYYFYRRIPKDVLEAYPHQQFIKETLGTSDFEEAKRKVREVSCEWDKRFDHERRKLAGQHDEISEALAEEIAARWLEDSAWNDEYSRQFRTRSDAEIDAESDAAFFYRVDYQEALAKGDRKSAEKFVRDVERSEGLNVERGSISHGRLAMALLRAAVEAMGIVEARNSGEWVKPPPAAPSTGSKSTAATSLEDGEPLSTVFAKWKAERQPSKKLASESAKAIRRFVQLRGDLPVEEITRRHVASFKDALLLLPARTVKALRDLPLPEQIKRAEGDGDMTTLSAASVKKDLGIIRAVLAWAVDNGYRDDNPATDIKIREAKNTGPRRLPYGADDLQRIFSCGIFTDGDRPRGGGGAAAHWLPLLALFTGARLEELGQLLVSDVRQDGGVCYLDINMRDAGKRLKTKSSERKVPLHHQLIRLGFLDYADSQRQGGGDVGLFPDLNVAKSSGVLTGNWSKWWGRYQRETIGITDHRKVFHSFRHTFKDACLDAEIEEAVHDALTGHSGGGVGRSYGQGYQLPVLDRAMQKVRHDGPDLSLVLPAEGERRR